MSSALPDPIRLFLVDFVARRRLLALVKASALALATFLAVLLLACVVDRFLHLSRPVRATLLLADLAAVLLILRRPVAEAFRPHADWVEAAAQVEAIDSTFAQRLITVTSQIQSNPSHRGSSGMLAALLGEVSVVTSQRHGATLIHWRRIRRSLTLAACFFAITVASLVIPWLQMSKLVGRFTRPWANLPPVTTTQLAVAPGSTAAPQGRPLRVNVTAGQVGESTVRLHVQQADGWAVTALEATDADHYAGETPPLDRDTQYYITGGDARSETYSVHVLTTPGLKDIRVHVDYPVYLNWPAKTLSLMDGKLDVPVGSDVTLSLVATEPLSDAVLLGTAGQREATSASVDPSVRTAKLQVKKGFAGSIVLTSSAGIEQKIAQPIVIRPIPDRPPLVRLLTPNEELRLTPTDLLTTAGQALDDYGIEQLHLQIKINDRPPIYQPIAITGERRRIEQTIDCDLATLNVDAGDLIQLVLLAKDGAGQQRGSETLRVTVSPQSFDLNHYLRIVDLKAAKKLADDLNAQLTTARNELGQPAESIAKDGDKSLANLSAAAQTAQLLTMPLLRAATRADQQNLGDMITTWLDAAEHDRSAAEELQDQRARRLDVNQIVGPLDQARDRATHLAEGLQKVVRYDQVLAVRSDALSARELKRRAEKAKPPERDKLLAAAQRLQASAQSAAGPLGLNLNENDGTFPSLDGAVSEFEMWARMSPQVDFPNVAREWQGVLQRVSAGNLLATQSSLELLAMEARLAMASQAESVRPGADFVRARDWSLAARAGSAIRMVAAVAGAPDSIKTAVNEYPAAVTDLHAEHALHRAAQKPADAGAIIAKAKQAREKMRRWAGGEDDAKLASANTLNALQAAALQERDFDEARKLDQARAAAGKSPATDAQKQKQLKSKTASAERLDQLRQRQQQLAQQSAEAIRKAADAKDTAAQEQLRSLAQQQQALAKAIEDAREQEHDAAKPISNDEQKPVDPAEAIARMRSALAELRQRNAAVAPAKDDAAKIEQATEVEPAGVETANEQLAKLSPVADDAQRQIDDKVVGGARQLQQEARSKNAEAVAHKSRELDAAIADAFKKLNAAEEKLADRDALAAAEAAAQQAAQQMKEAAGEPDDKVAEKPTPGETSPTTPSAPSTPSAQANQSSTPAKSPPPANAQASSSKSGKGQGGKSGPISAQARADAMAEAQLAQARTVSALDRAVDRATASGGQARVRESPFIDSLLSLLPVLVDGTGTGQGASDRTKIDVPAAREWGRLRPRDEANQTAVSTPADPAGYEQSLRLYFEALGREK